MIYDVFTCLLLLQIKHFMIDFVWQTEKQIKSKGIYGNLDGISHSFYHGLGTLMCLTIIGTSPSFILFLALIDMVVHYHIDWVKVNYGCKDITNKKFWNHLGFDQLMHQSTYLILVCSIAV